jgi:hypothetical protein
MLRTLRQYLASALLACAAALPTAAQNPAPSATAQGSAAAAPSDRSYVGEYLVAAIAIAVVLLVVCMPSRKQT